MQISNIKDVIVLFEGKWSPTPEMFFIPAISWYPSEFFFKLNFFVNSYTSHSLEYRPMLQGMRSKLFKRLSFVLEFAL